MTLQALQGLLGSIHDLPLTHCVEEFLLTDRSCFPPAPGASATYEQTPVAEDGDTIWISLFPEPGVLQRLASANPLQALHAGNLADY